MRIGESIAAPQTEFDRSQRYRFNRQVQLAPQTSHAEDRRIVVTKKDRDLLRFVHLCMVREVRMLCSSTTGEEPIEAIVCRRRMACSMGKTFPTPLICEWSRIPDGRKMAPPW